MSETAFHRLESIITVTNLANKWIMWAEMQLPSQDVFVPSIFQMRDAYTHLINMLGEGFVEGSEILLTPDDETGPYRLMTSERGQKQLRNATLHSARALADVAEYILLSIREELELKKSDKETGVINTLLDIAFIKFDQEITTLRQNKAAPVDDVTGRAYRWDSLLMKFTTIYGMHEKLIRAESYRVMLYKIIEDIEKNNDDTVIKDCMPQFFEEKVELSKRTSLITEYYALINSEEDLSRMIEGNPSEWQDDINHQLDMLSCDMDLKIQEYTELRNIIKGTNRNRKIQKTFVGLQSFIILLISSIIAPLTSAFAVKRLNPGATSFLFEAIITIAIIIISFLILSSVAWLIKKIAIRITKDK